MMMAMVESAGASLGNCDDGAGRPSSGGARTARIKELELAMNKRMFKHRLVGGNGNGSGGSNTSAKLGAKMEVVGGNLDRRASLEELTNQGIFQVTSACVVVWRTMSSWDTGLTCPFFGALGVARILYNCYFSVFRITS